jgi:ABC-2 type transport system permease protein
MTRLIQAELLKWRTMRALYAFAAGTAVIVALAVSAAIATAGRHGSAGLTTTEGMRDVFSGAVNAGFLVMIMGIITTAGEYRHNTITAAVITTPRRSRLIAAKTIAMAVIGTSMAALACAVTVAIALPWLATKGVHPSMLSRDVGLVLLGSSAVIVLFGLIGIGIGAVVRNQVAAIVGTLLWLLVVENMLVNLWPGIGKWLSFGAAGSMIGSVDAGLLPAGAAAVLLLGYGAVAIVAGVQLTARRDIRA